MHKVRLVLDELQVESFDTSPAQGRRGGTVHGHRIDVVGGVIDQPFSKFQECGSYPNCPSPLCVDTPLASCDDASCKWTCGASCNGSCASCATCDSCRETCPATCGECIPPDQTIAGFKF
jgi:hypothetical protein